MARTALHRVKSEPKDSVVRRENDDPRKKKSRRLTQSPSVLPLPQQTQEQYHDEGDTEQHTGTPSPLRSSWNAADGTFSAC